jgi:DNA polymerase III delta prime subunit
LNSECSENVRYCLICNYSSRIDESLQNDLLRLRFNQLPPDRIVAFLRRIVAAEGLSFTDEMLVAIQRSYQSDIRSMINLLQTRQSLAVSKFIPTDKCYAQIASLFEDESVPPEEVYNSILDHCSRYRSNERAFLKEYLGYVVKCRDKDLTRDSVSLMSQVVHDRDSRPSVVLRYFVSSWADVIRSEGGS